MLFSFDAIDPKCLPYQAKDLICFGGDCQVVICSVEVTGKDNTQVLVFRELFNRFSINCISCSIKIKRKIAQKQLQKNYFLAQKQTWTNLASLKNKSDVRLFSKLFGRNFYEQQLVLGRLLYTVK